MSLPTSVLSVGGWLALLAVAYGFLSSGGVRSWATRPTGSVWIRRLGFLAVIVAAGAAGSFSWWPPAGVYLFAVVGALAYLVGVLAAAGALGTAFAATDEAAAFGVRVRSFWYAANHHYRATRSATGLSLLAFLLSGVVAGVSVDQTILTVGALSLGGALACVSLLAITGAFLPASRNERVADAVDRVRG